jgi:signal transduction histidine kinase
MAISVAPLISSIGSILLVISTIGDIMLGLMVYRSNPKSATNKIFFALSILIALWLPTGALYLAQFSTILLLVMRLGIFFAAPMSMLFFWFAYTVPNESFPLSKPMIWTTTLLTAIMMAFNISPYAFSQVETVGNTPVVTTGLGIIPFSIISTIFSILAIYFLIKKAFMTAGESRGQIRTVLIGMVVMLLLVIGTILVPLIFFHSGLFIVLLPIYTLVFLGATAYAITRYHLFNLKIIATESLTIILCIILFAKIFVDKTATDVIVDSLIFLVTIVFGILLVKSVRSEVRQREELERLNRQIAEKNNQLEDLSRFKSQLLSLASHQIKSPLAAIKGFVSLISEGAYGEVGDRVKETLKKVQNSADDLIGLINTLLDVRKVEEGKMEYKFERVDVNDMTAKVIDLLQPLAQAKKLALSFAPAPRPVWVNADPEKLKQVVQNIIDNAIKYTPTGFVKVSLDETAPVDTAAKRGTLVISATDSGLGIAAELIPHLFEEFVRDERVKKEIRGTGLGLYIAQKIAEAHGGKITAESPGEGKGSAFHITLPEIS